MPSRAPLEPAAAPAAAPARPASRLRANVAANFSGQVAVTAIHLAMIPLYVRYLGVEAYGLVGFFLTLQAMFQVLDLGVSPTVNRELARYSATPDSAGEARDFVRTLEVAYWLAGGLLGATLFAAAPLIATRWLGHATLPPGVIVDAVRMMGLLVAAQWPLTFYQGGLLGLGRHGALNAVRVGMTLVSAGGAFLVLSQVSATIGAFFRWQAAASLLYMAVMASTLWRCLPRSPGTPRFRSRLIAAVWRFAAGMTGMTIAGLVLTQGDKVVLSRVAPLEQFGYYAVAGVVSSGLYTVISPMFASLFPRFSALVAAADAATLRTLYRRAWLIMAALIVPGAAVIGAFAEQILLLWTRDPALARTAAPLVSLLVLGTALNGLMNVPYALQLAYGWTTLPLRLNAALAVAAVPMVLLLTLRYGAFGAAMMWPVVNIVYLLVALPMTHRHFPAPTAGDWLWRDVGRPVLAALVVVAMWRALLPRDAGALVAAAFMAGAGISAELVLVLSSEELRHEMKRYAVKCAGYAGLA